MTIVTIVFMPFIGMAYTHWSHVWSHVFHVHWHGCHMPITCVPCPWTVWMRQLQFSLIIWLVRYLTFLVMQVMSFDERIFNSILANSISNCDNGTDVWSCWLLLYPCNVFTNLFIFNMAIFERGWWYSQFNEIRVLSWVIA